MTLYDAARDFDRYCEARRTVPGFELMSLADALRRVDVPDRSHDTGAGRPGTTWDPVLGQWVRTESATLAAAWALILIGLVGWTLVLLTLLT